ncbi:biotin-dependent carboxyltransferase family protein [Robertkochia solimangrovi]|uniref:5-oxoprolinase subunit C family protein n=1 Tax=Robertkochia solimangrovi TaxID=2213046 RepID=UPI001180C77B|nr:biotin-dependent carboxyltransferase family protein [Robertkochia solimangrovi]TRZ42564.1 allophanate hydrolase subunit 2 family protein [Robertkochia solimangrovi]
MIKVLNPGIYTTVQDQGRFGYRDKGVPVSGFMDTISGQLANSLVGNPIRAAVLEMTMTGPEMIFDEDGVFAITGALMSPKLNGEDISNNRAYEVKKGDVLKFGRLVIGFRSYLAIAGGFTTEKVLNSRSWYFPITSLTHLPKGYELPVGEKYKECDTDSIHHENEIDFDDNRLKVFTGPEYDLISKDQQEQLLNGIFSVAKENNRMAYQLNESIFPHNLSILTSATRPGTVQLTPAGKLIILMKDAQTTGGYPRIFQLSDEAICLLAQKKTGDEICFERISI